MLSMLTTSLIRDGCPGPRQNDDRHTRWPGNVSSSLESRGFGAGAAYSGGGYAGDVVNVACARERTKASRIPLSFFCHLCLPRARKQHWQHRPEPDAARSIGGAPQHDSKDGYDG